MKVDFYATYRQIVGGKTVEIPVARELTVRELVEEIVTRYPPLRAELLNDQGELYAHVHVFVNGRDAPYLVDGVETPLGPDDTVSVFPPAAGGAG
ncbi:MAG TPA: ubiquitin-like small modifier protein 1 [Anaerolineae bacterium]|nr:ubiquitin-like small modifier protein 1 [Anaerolineae bacterium]